LGFHILHSLVNIRWISKALLGRLTEINGDPMDTLAERAVNYIAGVVEHSRGSLIAGVYVGDKTGNVFAPSNLH
jgi:hypothetical protein